MRVRDLKGARRTISLMPVRNAETPLSSRSDLSAV